MAKDETKSVGAATLKADADALAAIIKMTDYKPSKDDFALVNLKAGSADLKTAGDAFAQTEADWQTARNGNVAAEWTFHNLMLGAKQQIIAQYGDDSDEAQAVGLTKKSERSKPARKNTATATPASK